MSGSPKVESGSHRPATALIPWWFVFALGALLPVEATARWFHATYLATPADVRLGVWLFKASVVLLAVAALILHRLDRPSHAPEQDIAASPSWTPILIIAAVALVLRIYRLNTELWLDEIEMMVRYIPLDLRQLLSTYDTQNHHPFYTILAHLSWVIGGGADWTVRIPAALFGVASIIAVYRFARGLVGEAEALLTALVLSVSYHHVWFSQNARGYTAILFLTVLATGAFVRLLSGVGRPVRVVWAYAVLMALATWTHLTAALIAVGHAGALLLAADWRSKSGRTRAAWAGSALALSGLLTIVLYAPMLPQVVRQLTTPPVREVEVEWTSLRWLLSEGARALSGGIPGGMAALLVALVVLAIGVGSLWRRSRVAVLAMYLPVAVTAAAVIAAGHNLWPRFFFFAAGFLVLTAIRGGFAIVERLIPWRPRQVAVTGALGVALLSLLTVPRAWQPKQQFRAAYDFVEGERAPGDAVVAVDIAFHPYLMRGSAPDWYMTTSAGLLGDVERRANRTWIVYTLPTRLRAIAPELWERIAPPRYEEVRVFSATVGGGEIHVLRHDPTP